MHKTLIIKELKNAIALRIEITAPAPPARKSLASAKRAIGCGTP
jgi:hypothetical protein